jgi:hypothetical protein
MCLKTMKRKNKEEDPVADSTKAKALCASTQEPRVPTEAKQRERGEEVEEDQEYFINTDAVFASAQGPVVFDLCTPEFIQVRDPARSESPSTNKDEAEEEERNNKSLRTNKDDEA